MENRLQLANIEEAAKVIGPEFLNTPQFRCEPLEDILGCRLLVKVETLNPIRSFKGRGASYYISKQENSKTIVCASAGNLGQAVAYVCRERGMEAIIFASTNANPLKINRMRQLGAKVILQGEDFDAAKLMAQAYANTHNLPLIEDSLDVETCEGAGTIARELLTYKEPIDIVYVALGNGALLTGIARWIKAFSPSTQVVGVVAEGASCMADSFSQNKVVEYEKTDTISDGIAVRTPIVQVLSDMKSTVDRVVAVKDKTTIKAMKLLHTHLGITVEPSGAVGLAAILENPQLCKGKLASIVVCGGNITPEQMKVYL